jgi:hypothetical protein
MHSHLRLTQEDPELHLQPDTLLAHLEKSVTNFDTLLQDLHCSAEDLQQTLDDPNTSQLLTLKTNVAVLQLRLLAIKYIPHAFAKLVSLMAITDKPEVARRSCATVLQIAGIPTHTTPNPAPTPPPTPTQTESNMSDDEAAELLSIMAFGKNLRRQGFDPSLLSRLSSHKPDDIIQFLTSLATTLPTTQ